MSVFAESDLLPISALQHLSYCKRQCALIHLERVWAESRATADGRHFHERVHERADESRRDVRLVRGLSLRSMRHGLAGVADVVEFWKDETRGVVVPGLRGTWMPLPIEYKRGRAKQSPCDAVQLCAQALCLEEMLNVSILSGCLFYGLSRRRLEVVFDASLRAATESVARELHELIDGGHTPPPEPGPKCKECSLAALCMPGSAGRAVSRYVEESLGAFRTETEP